MSEAGYTKDKHYQFLLKYFPANKIHIRYSSLWADTVKVIETAGLESIVRIDEESFQMAIIDYFTDIARLKDFQDIERVNVDKIYGYEMFWFLRRHPIQLLEDTPVHFDINEKIALGVFLPRILAEAGLPYTVDDQNEDFRKRLKLLIDLLFYNLKFRTYTQQSLELMIEAFICGCDCTRTVTYPRMSTIVGAVESE
jgi:hypothetical protein